MRSSFLPLACSFALGALAGCTSNPGSDTADLTGTGDPDLSTPAADLNTPPAEDLRSQLDLTGGPHPMMSFFITSRTGSGNLSGLAGADATCQRLAAAVGMGDKKWVAYLSTTAAAGQPAVNARDRIGKGPWYNFKGEKIADDVQGLHDTKQMGVTKATGLTEDGKGVNGRGDTPNQHDILTGSTAEGRPGTTCANWTSEAETGATASVGHHDLVGGGSNLWNFAHESRGCSAAALVMSGGAGRFYCFSPN